MKSMNLNLIALVIAGSLVSGCAKEKDASVSMRFQEYTVAQNGPELMIQRKPTLLAEQSVAAQALRKLLGLMMPDARAAVSEVRMCFKRLRFKQEGDATDADVSQDEDNIDLELGLVALDAAGTGLGSVTLPPATYKRVEFDLEDGCGTGYSLYVDNAGVYQTTDRITIKFEGTFQAEGGDQTLAMSVQSIITALDGVIDSNDLKDVAEAASGSF